MDLRGKNRSHRLHPTLHMPVCMERHLHASGLYSPSHAPRHAPSEGSLGTSSVPALGTWEAGRAVSQRECQPFKECFGSIIPGVHCYLPWVCWLLLVVKNNINGTTLKGLGTAISNLSNVKTGKNSLWAGPKATLYLIQLCKDNKKTGIMTTGLTETLFRIMLCYLHQ